MKRSLLFSLLLILILSGCAKTESQTVFAMNTVMEFTVHAKEAGDVIARMTQRIYDLEAMFSRTAEGSDVSTLNHANGAETEVSFEVFSLLETAQSISHETGGAFDISIAPVVSAWGFTEAEYRVPSPEELEALLPLVDYSSIITAQQGETCSAALQSGQAVDLGGIAKGYASDCMADIFLAGGAESGYVSLGGNILAWGAKSDGSPWRIGVKDPVNTDSLCGVLELKNAYAVTSGGYERFFTEEGVTYHHIIDPATGYPAESDLLSVTVVMDWNGTPLKGSCGNGTLCDALSTALFVMGEEKALEFWRRGVYDFDLVLVTKDSQVLVTPDLTFTPTESSTCYTVS